jgi:hypothetical protein
MIPTKTYPLSVIMGNELTDKERTAELEARLKHCEGHAAELEAENVRLREAMDKYSEDEITIEAATFRLLINEAITTMSHAEIFIESREKMHPTGVKLWGDLLDRMRTALTTYKERNDG